MPHTIAVRSDTPNFIMFLTLVRTLRHCRQYAIRTPAPDPIIEIDTELITVGDANDSNWTPALYIR
jgi:hypothetical protein